MLSIRSMASQTDPMQNFDEAGGFELDEAGEDDPIPVADREVAEPEGDVGDLYGVHTPPAAAPFESVESQDDEGRNWLEALEADSTENGPQAEHVIDVTDDSDTDNPGHHKTDTRDRPVADKGSGGPAGL